jgi:hypothetical protein
MFLKWSLDEGKMNPYTILVECKFIQLFYETIWQLLKTLKLDQSYDLAIPTPQCKSKE